MADVDLDNTVQQRGIEWAIEFESCSVPYTDFSSSCRYPKDLESHRT